MVNFAAGDDDDKPLLPSAPITKIIVYNNGALVTRLISLKSITPGIHSIRVDKLPFSLLENTFRLNYEQNNIKINYSLRRYTAFSKGVNTHREQLLQKLESLEIEQKRLRADLNFLESYASKIVNPNMLPFSPNLFVDAGVLYQDRGRELEEALVENKRNLEEVKADLSRFEIESKTRKDYYLLEAQLEVNEKEVDISMTISYVVPDVLWRPQYDINVTENGLSVVYQATLQQNSGEDWHSVDLTLSTSSFFHSTKFDEKIAPLQISAVHASSYFSSSNPFSTGFFGGGGGGSFGQFPKNTFSFGGNAVGNAEQASIQWSTNNACTFASAAPSSITSVSDTAPASAVTAPKSADGFGIATSTTSKPDTTKQDANKPFEVPGKLFGGFQASRPIEATAKPFGSTSTIFGIPTPSQSNSGSGSAGKYGSTNTPALGTSFGSNIFGLNGTKTTSDDPSFNSNDTSNKPKPTSCFGAFANSPNTSTFSSVAQSSFNTSVFSGAPANTSAFGSSLVPTSFGNSTRTATKSSNANTSSSIFGSSTTTATNSPIVNSAEGAKSETTGVNLSSTPTKGKQETKAEKDEAETPAKSSSTPLKDNLETYKADKSNNDDDITRVVMEMYGTTWSFKQNSIFTPKTANVSSTEYPVKTLGTISSGKDAIYNIEIGHFELEAKVHRVILPSLCFNTRLLAQVRNTSKFCLLSGTAFIVKNGVYCLTTTLPDCDVGDSFTLLLGFDGKVKAKTLPSRRLVTSRHSHNFAIKITEQFGRGLDIQNFYEEDVKIHVFIPIPIGASGSFIELKMLWKQLNDEKRDVSKEEKETGLLHYEHNIKAKENFVLGMAFQVTYGETFELRGV